MSQQYQKQKQKWYEKGVKEEKEKWKQAVQELKKEIKENCELEVNENGLIMIIDKIFGELTNSPNKSQGAKK